ncbi:MAG: DNA translocase FtsK [Bacillota bacterium]|nr:DNA translocase FtsK [Bacillota bacterium]
MSSAARKKTKINIRSTDRAGSVLLPLGVALIVFSWMLFLGATLQTSSAALHMMKNLAIGLGGGLYLVLPVLLMWLGVLIVISSKRYVSFYAFSISLLIFLTIGALMNLTLGVDNSDYPRLMDYIGNYNKSFRQASNADSLGEYLKTSFNLHNTLRIGTGFYPGGGALSMLIAYPLYSSIGNTAGIVFLILALIALIFALLRVSPVHLINTISARVNRVHDANTVNAQPVYQTPVQQDDLSAQTVQQQPAAWPNQSASTAWQTSDREYPEPVIPVSQYNPSAAQSTVEPGFVAQPQETFLDEFAYNASANQKAAPVWPAYDQKNSSRKTKTQAWGQTSAQTGDLTSGVNQQQPSEPVWTAVRPEQPATEPLAVDQHAIEPRTGNGQSAGVIPEQEAKEPVYQHPAKKQPEMIPEETITIPVNEPVYSEPVTKPIGTDKKPVSSIPKPVHTAPAFELTGERVPIKKREETFNPTSLDGMAKPAAPKQIKLALDDYQAPPLRLLTENTEEQNDTTEEDRIRANKLIETLSSFQISASLHDIVHGPTVTRFAIRLAEGVNVSKLRNVMDNLTIELRAKGDIRAEIPIPGTSFVGLEVSNDKTSKVYLREVLESPRMRENKSPTTVALGKDITGTPITCELMDMPHLLIAGATGSGKSVCINSIICSILYRASPRNVRLIMVDPKFVELQPYNNVPHLWCPVITDAQKATRALEWVCQEMDKRYQIMVDAGVRNLDAYNKKLGPDEDPLPRIIVIVDEMADLMTTSGKMIEDSIKRITAKARAAGICLILATQRPSVNIITGVIKANIPGRIAFRVSSPFDSKTILDSQGAEKLLGYGDMLYRSMTRDPIRVQGCFVSDHDVEQTVEFIRSRNKAEYNLDLTEHMEKDEQSDNGNGMGEGEGGDAEFDELLPQAIEMAVEAGQMSISMLQRVLRVGYARSGRLIDEMTRRGIISGNEGTKPRRTLMTREQYLNYLENGN